jgi:hypothetical protein
MSGHQLRIDDDEIHDYFPMGQSGGYLLKQAIKYESLTYANLHNTVSRPCTSYRLHPESL